VANDVDQPSRPFKLFLYEDKHSLSFAVSGRKSR